MTKILRFGPAVTLAMMLGGCHPQAAVPRTASLPQPLEQEVVETAIRSRVSELSACLADANVVPGSSNKLVAAMEVSIADTGKVQRVTVKIDDPDINECLVHKVSQWVFPHGGLTAAKLVLLLEAKSAGLARVNILGGEATRASAR